MKRFNIFSVAILAAGLFTSAFVQGQSCDTLRNFIVPANNNYSVYPGNPTTGIILGQNILTDGTDSYNTDIWIEPYSIGTANSQIRAIRMLPYKKQNNSGSAKLTIQVYGDNSGAVGTLLGSQDVDYNALNGEMYWSLVEFATPVD